MIRACTRWVVAYVAHDHAFRNWSNVYLVGKAMCGDAADHPVVPAFRPSSPTPTPFRVTDDAPIESFFDGQLAIREETFAGVKVCSVPSRVNRGTHELDAAALACQQHAGAPGKPPSRPFLRELVSHVRRRDAATLRARHDDVSIGPVMPREHPDDSSRVRRAPCAILVDDAELPGDAAALPVRDQCARPYPVFRRLADLIPEVFELSGCERGSH